MRRSMPELPFSEKKIYTSIYHQSFILYLNTSKVIVENNVILLKQTTNVTKINVSDI
jgi:hypothetical protein